MVAGRPRAFCTEEALDKALAVFWEKGYEGASLQDLTEAMGINRPSLYSAYGNKESLFLKAIDRYLEKNSCFLEYLEEPDIRKGIENLFRWKADALTDPCTPHGCMMVTGALACSDETSRIREELAKRRCESQKLVQQRLERAQAEGQLPKDIDAAAFSRYLGAVSYGMSILASSGATSEQLHEVVTIAMQAWPQKE